MIKSISDSVQHSFWQAEDLWSPLQVHQQLLKVNSQNTALFVPPPKRR